MLFALVKLINFAEGNEDTIKLEYIASSKLSLINFVIKCELMIYV